MPFPWAYSIATTLGGLATVTPVPKLRAGPYPVRYIPPVNRGRSLAGHDKFQGLEGREWYWDRIRTEDLAEIFAVFNGAYSIDGFVRTPDWFVTGSGDVFADWSCVLHAPIQGEWDLGGLRATVMMKITDMSRIQTSP